MLSAEEKIISSEEKVISKKEDELTVQRIAVVKREGMRFKTSSLIKKKLVTKKMLPKVIERTKWKKFGIVEKQERGTIEPGVVMTSMEEIHIVNRLKNVAADLGDKLKDAIKNKKNFILQQMKEAKLLQEQEQAFNQATGTRPKSYFLRRSNESTIKVNGFPPSVTAEDLGKLFSEVGIVDRVVVPNPNTAYVKFAQSLHVKDAFDKFEGYAIKGCCLAITLPKKD